MNDESRESLKNDLQELCENYGIKTDDIVRLIRNEEIQKEEKELRDKVAGNSHLVGKAYRKKVKKETNRIIC